MIRVKTPNFSWGIVKFSLRRCGEACPVLYRDATRAASGAAVEELNIGGEEKRRAAVGRNETSPN